MLNKEKEIISLLSDEKKLKKLYLLEKRKRQVDINKLVFLGVSNIASYKWCSIKSVLRSQEEEFMFFCTYLYDRLAFSFSLNLIKKLPRKEEQVLEIGNDITLDQIEELLKEVKKLSTASITVFNKDGRKITVINPKLSPSEKYLLIETALNEGETIITPEEAPWKLRGKILESSIAENYPTIRWNFQWNDYVIIGMPDGISTDLIYEFKSTKNRFLLNFIKPVAFAQADLYGFFFKKNRKKVHIYILEEQKIESWEGPVDQNNALNILNKFSLTETNQLSTPPKKWKCHRCEFNASCPIS